MGFVKKLIDAVIFFFLVMFTLTPLFDAQTILPAHYFPSFLIDLKAKYTIQFGDYFYAEEPHFFIGLAWVELLLMWPLAVVSVYAKLTGKTWFHFTTVIQATSMLTSLGAVTADMIRSGKSSEMLDIIYYPLLGYSVLAFFRGLIGHFANANGAGELPALRVKKKA